MDAQLIVLILQILVLVGSYLVGRFVLPNLSSENIQEIVAKTNLIIDYADKFVSWAKYFMKDSSGVERMAEVVKKLKVIADKYNLDMSEEEIQAIAQKAYDQMKAGMKEAENQKAIADAAKETATVVLPVVSSTQANGAIISAIADVVATSTATTEEEPKNGHVVLHEEDSIEIKE